MNQELLTKMLDGRKELRSLPQTLAEILRLARDESASANQFANVIAKDPGMTVKVLRIVNSPYYGLKQKISSMSQAVMVIGIRQIVALALSSSVYQLTSTVSTGIDKVRFWRHSLEVAIACRMIAERMKHPRPEQLFVAGLLHDLGLLILEGSYPKEFQIIWQKAESDNHLIELEEDMWGTNHALMAQFLFEQWRLPDEICIAVGKHLLTFPDGGQIDELREAQIVSLANKLSRFNLRARNYALSISEQANRQVLERNLGLADQSVAEIERQLVPVVVQEAKYLEIDIGAIDELLMEANRLLFEQMIAVESLLAENRKMQVALGRSQQDTAEVTFLKDAVARQAQKAAMAAELIASRVDALSHQLQAAKGTEQGMKLLEGLAAMSQGAQSIQKGMNELRQDIARFDPAQGEHPLVEKIAVA